MPISGVKRAWNSLAKSEKVQALADALQKAADDPAVVKSIKNVFADTMSGLKASVKNGLQATKGGLEDAIKTVKSWFKPASAKANAIEEITANVEKPRRYIRTDINASISNIGKDDIVANKRAEPIKQAIEYYMPEAENGYLPDNTRFYIETDGTKQIIRLEVFDPSNSIDYYSPGGPGHTGRILESFDMGNKFKDATQISLTQSVSSSHFIDTLKLKPNVEYTANGYNYRTDGLSRIEHANADLRLGSNIRNKYHQRMAGGKDRLDTDQGGHLVGRQFDGSELLDNIVAMDKDVNQKSYKQLENKWVEALQRGQKVHINIDIIYEGNSLRPSRINVRYSIDGFEFTKDIKNTRG